MTRCALLVLALLAPAARAAGPPPPPATELFVPAGVWDVHLTISAENWQKMQPTRGTGLGGAPRPNEPLPPGRVARGGFGYDFEYVTADLVIGGRTFKNVAVRFKGNSSYMMMARSLKRPLKIDLDKNVPGQSFLGVTKLVLNNNTMDATAARESLAYAVYRAAGVAAPRTSYAALRLTVPGKYSNELVGLYTLIEAVDRPFLKDRFGSDKGLLLKPERVGPLDYLGADWARYAERYRPKTKASEAARKKLIALAHLVQHGSDEKFHQEIGKLLDVDAFLRYAAATVLLSSVDSFIGFAHNYYLYLDPKTGRFVIVPWDLDHSFGALVMLASSSNLIDLSIRRPHLGRNPLVEKLLGDEKIYAVYKGHLARLLKGGFTPAGIKRDLEAITRATAPTREREKKAVSDRGDAWGGWAMGLMMGRPPELLTFVTRRAASVRAQLDGKSQGTQLQSRWNLGGPAGALVRPILREADLNRDRQLTRQEMTDGLKELWKKLDATKGPLDEKALAAGLDKLLPKQPGAKPGQLAGELARSIAARAAKDGRVTEKGLLAAAEALFARHDRDRSGKLDERELAAAVQELLPVAGPFERPAPGKPKGAEK